MSTTRIDYTITTKHPAGYRDGEHKVTVNVNTDGTRYVTGDGFGCSRDYRTDTDEAAISLLLREHAMYLVSCRTADSIDGRCSQCHYRQGGREFTPATTCPKCPGYVAPLPLRPISRRDILPGMSFYFTTTSVTPCIALDSAFLDKGLKKLYHGGADKAWHLYTPNGSISWTSWEGTVYVLDESAK